MWQIMAFLSLGLASISTGYALWIRQNTTYQPYVIAIDKIGTPVFAGFPERIEYADRRVIQNLLADFVANFRSIAPLSEASYQIDWIEIVRKPNGDEKNRIAMKGVVQVQMIPPQSEAVIRANPIGLYIKDFDWTQQF